MLVIGDSDRSLQCQEYTRVSFKHSTTRREEKTKQNKTGGTFIWLELGLGWRLVNLRVTVRSKVEVGVRVIVGLGARSKVTVTVTVKAGVMVRADT